MAADFIRMRYFWMTIIKLCLCITCYVLFCIHYEINTMLCDNWPTDVSQRICYVHSQIVVTACVAFTFVIEPAIIIAYIFAAKQLEETPLIYVFALAGFVTYITAGCLIYITAFSNDHIEKPYVVTTSMFAVTGGLYFYPIGNYTLERIRCSRRTV